MLRLQSYLQYMRVKYEIFPHAAVLIQVIAPVRGANLFSMELPNSEACGGFRGL